MTVDDDTIAHLQARRERVTDLKARLDAGKLTAAEFTAELGKLWGAPPGATPQQIVAHMTEYVKRTAPEAAHAERVLAQAVRKLKGGG